MEMIDVRIQSKYFDSNSILEEIELNIKPKEFISIIGPSSVGTWFILFPIMGIAGHLLRSNRPLEIPLIPYMFSAWCLVYTIQHSYIF